MFLSEFHACHDALTERGHLSFIRVTPAKASDDAAPVELFSHGTCWKLHCELGTFSWPSEPRKLASLPMSAGLPAANVAGGGEAVAMPSMSFNFHAPGVCDVTMQNTAFLSAGLPVWKSKTLFLTPVFFYDTILIYALSEHAHPEKDQVTHLFVHEDNQFTREELAKALSASEDVTDVGTWLVEQHAPKLFGFVKGTAAYAREKTDMGTLIAREDTRQLKQEREYGEKKVWSPRCQKLLEIAEIGTQIVCTSGLLFDLKTGKAVKAYCE